MISAVSSHFRNSVLNDSRKRSAAPRKPCGRGCSKPSVNSVYRSIRACA